MADFMKGSVDLDNMFEKFHGAKSHTRKGRPRKNPADVPDSIFGIDDSDPSDVNASDKYDIEVARVVAHDPDALAWRYEPVGFKTFC